MTNILIRMKEQTLEQTDMLQKKFQAPSRSDVIRRAIDLSYALTAALQKGDKILIEGNGRTRELIIPGVSHAK